MRFSMKLISVLGATVLALTGVTIQADTPKAGGTLIMSIGTTPRHLNPAVQSGIATGAPGAQISPPCCGLMISGILIPTSPNRGRCRMIQ